VIQMCALRRIPFASHGAQARHAQGFAEVIFA
jgi:hypothetical protein